MEGNYEPVVQAVGLTKMFRDFWQRPKARAVNGIDFEIRYSNGKFNNSTLANCEYFNVCKYTISSAGFFSTDKHSFNSVLCLDGNGTLEFNGECFSLTKGDSYFIPANLGNYTIKGNLEIVVSKI